jgi:hypothetical protein
MRSQLIALSLLLAMTASSQVAKADTYSQWAHDKEHQLWIQMHPDRAHFFTAHPEAAEKYRSEWADWHQDKVEYKNWADQHPDWVAKHQTRHDYFIAHPENTEKYRHEWYAQKETRQDYNNWLNNHSDWGQNKDHGHGHGWGHDRDHDNGHHDHDGDQH